MTVMAFDPLLHEVLAVGPQFETGAPDGWCEHWRLEGVHKGAPYEKKGERQGDRDCRTPAVYAYEKRVGGRVVNHFRSCQRHRHFIEREETGWSEVGYHPVYTMACGVKV